MGKLFNSISCQVFEIWKIIWHEHKLLSKIKGKKKNVATDHILCKELSETIDNTKNCNNEENN